MAALRAAPRRRAASTHRTTSCSRRSPPSRRRPRPARTDATATSSRWPRVGSAPATASSPTRPRSRHSPIRSATGRPSRIRPPRWPGSTSASASASSPTATTTCSPARRTRLGTTFDWVVTAQSVGSYKPDERNFEVAFERIGLPRERILHVAQSLFHDHVPAKRLGLTTVWIDRRAGRPGGARRRRRRPRRTPPSPTWRRSPRRRRDLTTSLRARVDGGDEVRQQGRPAALVPVAPRLGIGAERLPAAMLDLDEGRRVACGRGTGSRPRSRRRGRAAGATGRRTGAAAPRP